MGPADNDEIRSDIAAPRQPRHPAAIDEEPGSEQRRRALDRMVEIAEEAGMYDRTAVPKRTRHNF
ncbi:MAG: hypothetical protein WA797_11475 [Acidimicrobiales bacterium]